MTAYLVEKMSIRKVAVRFSVSKSLVQKLVKLQKTEGNLQPKKTGKPQFSYLTNSQAEVKELVADHPDATLGEWEHFTFVMESPPGFVCVAAPLGVRRWACKIEMLPRRVM